MSKNPSGISQLLSQVNDITETVSNDNHGAGTWPTRFGFKLVKVSIENIKYTDASKALVQRFNENLMSLRAYEDISQRASDISAQQRIAEGIQCHGLGSAGGMVYGVNLAQTLGMQAETKHESLPEIRDERIEKLKAYKKLLDEGILSEQEFAEVKRQLLNGL